MKITTKTTTWSKPKSSTNEMATFPIFPIHWQMTADETEDRNKYMWREFLQQDASADPLHSWMQQERVRLLCRKETNIDGKDCAIAYLPECQPTTEPLQAHPEEGRKKTLSRIQHVHRAPHPIYNLLLSQWAVDAPTDTYLNCEQVSIAFSCRWAFQRIRRKQPAFAFPFFRFLLVFINEIRST